MSRRRRRRRRARRAQSVGDEQVILVERTLTGAIDIPDSHFDAADPIVSAGGVPVTHATVEIIDSLGRVTAASKTERSARTAKAPASIAFRCGIVDRSGIALSAARSDDHG